MKKVLITGGSGFIGTNLISFLKAQGGYSLINIDINRPQKGDQVDLWRNVDIRDMEALSRVVIEFKPDSVVHLAARTDLNGLRIQDYDSNTIGVKNLIDVIEQCSTVDRVLVASSMYVCNPGYKPSSMDDYAPHTIYGESKVLTEKIVKESKMKTPWVLFRPTSLWGPWFGKPYIDFFNIVLSRKYFHLGYRACSKTYGYIENSVRQIEALLNSDICLVRRQVFYLGDWPAYNISEWANEIASKKAIKVPKIPYFLFVLAGYFGDFLKVFKVHFPMTSFRLSNMTTDNVHDLNPIKELMPNLPFSRMEGIDRTLTWMEKQGEGK